jgi:hypothetical protein
LAHSLRTFVTGQLASLFPDHGEAEHPWQKDMIEQSCSLNVGQKADRQEGVKNKVYPSKTWPQ